METLLVAKIAFVRAKGFDCGERVAFPKHMWVCHVSHEGRCGMSKVLKLAGVALGKGVRMAGVTFAKALDIIVASLHLSFEMLLG